MLLFNILKIVSRLRVRDFASIAAYQQNQIKKSYKSCYITEESKLLGKTIVVSYGLKNFHTDEVKQQVNSPKVILPALTDDAVHLMPGIFKTISNLFYLHGVIKNRLDPDFEISEFLEGSKQAVAVVSAALAREDYDSLCGLLTNNLIDKLKGKISTLSQEQKNLIRIHKADIYIILPYNIQVVHEGDRTFVEITVTYHSMQGLHKMEEDEIPNIGSVFMPQYRNKVFLSNYVFRKDYTNSNTEHWVITMCNEMTWIVL